MENPASGPEVIDSLILRFVGEEEDGSSLHELRAAHVAEVLQGIVELAGDFVKAGALGHEVTSEVLVKPAREGSFLLEVLRVVQDSGLSDEVAVGGPSLSAILWWATKSVRADVKDFDYLENGNVKVCWQDDTVQEIPRQAWDELQKRKRRRKGSLRKIMAPLSDERVTAVEVAGPPATRDEDDEVPPPSPGFTLTRPDYDAVRPEDEIDESFGIFEVEAQMSAIDFDDADKWKVKTATEKREATVEDEQFLGRVASGLAIRKNDIFTLEIREDRITKNGRTRRKWTVLRVKGHRRAVYDDGA